MKFKERRIKMLSDYEKLRIFNVCLIKNQKQMNPYRLDSDIEENLYEIIRSRAYDFISDTTKQMEILLQNENISIDLERNLKDCYLRILKLF